jgi:hypothetical protein
MRWNRAAVAALIVAASASARAEDAPKDEAARRAAIAKLGRLAWSDVGKPLSFCDLDGSNVVDSATPPATSVTWLPDGARVIADAGGTIWIVDSKTGKAVDLAPERRSPDEKFTVPRLSPDGSRALARHVNTAHASGWQSEGYRVFDLATGKSTEIAPAAEEDWLGGPPPAWWAPDGSVVAVLGTSPETLVRVRDDGKPPVLLATAPKGCRIRRVAFLGEKIAYSLEGRSHVEVRDTSGAQYLSEDVLAQPTYLRWDDGGASLRFEMIFYNTRVASARRLVAGKPPEPIPPTPVARAQIVSDDGKWRLTTRTAKTDVPDGDPIYSWTLLRVDAASGAETDLGPGRLPVRFGDVYVYWRVTVPDKAKEGRFFEHRKTIRGTEDLWAYDPKDGAVIRLSTRGFTPRCREIRATPTALKDK